MTLRWAFLAALSTIALAQEPIARVNTRFVEVDVVVRGKTGAVGGLTANDFTLYDNGKPQKIANFNVYQRASYKPTGALPANVFSNRDSRTGEPPKGLTVILLDMMNMGVENQAEVRRQVAKYLVDHGNEDRLALYSMGKTIQVLQDFTDDPERLVNLVKKFHPETSVDFTAGDLTYDLPITGDEITDAMTQNAAKEMQDNARLRRVEATVAALQAVAKHLSGVPGRKKLIWFSESFPARFTEMRSRVKAQQIEIFDYAQYIDKAVKALNDANVAMYPIDPRDPYHGGFNAPGIDTMNLFAGKTGGKAQYVLSDLSAAMRTAVVDDEIEYEMGFYPIDLKLDGSFHDLKVKVDRPGVEIRNRKGYIAGDTAPPAKARTQIADGIFSGPLEATGLGLMANIRTIPQQQGLYRLDLRVNVSELRLSQETVKGTPVWVALIQFATKFPTKTKVNGSSEDIKVTLTEARLKETLRNGLVISRALASAPGDVRIAIVDRNSGAAGSIKLALP